jgi:hypothetical protein
MLFTIMNILFISSQIEQSAYISAVMSLLWLCFNDLCSKFHSHLLSCKILFIILCIIYYIKHTLFTWVFFS